MGTFEVQGDQFVWNGQPIRIISGASHYYRVVPEYWRDRLKEYQPDQPLMCMEFWNGWFDHWGEQHHTREAADVAQVLDEMLAAGASVNFYMFHGGTNFGFYNGANNSPYAPTITSYDYDVLLSESGEPTAKYAAVREVIARYVELPAPIKKLAYGMLQMTEQADLFAQLDALGEPTRLAYPVAMEKLGQDYGFILYTTQVSGPRGRASLYLQEVRDRAIVYLDGRYLGVIERYRPELQSLEVEIPAGGATWAATDAVPPRSAAAGWRQ